MAKSKIKRLHWDWDSIFCLAFFSLLRSAGGPAKAAEATADLTPTQTYCNRPDLRSRLSLTLRRKRQEVERGRNFPNPHRTCFFLEHVVPQTKNFQYYSFFLPRYFWHRNFGNRRTLHIKGATRKRKNLQICGKMPKQIVFFAPHLFYWRNFTKLEVISVLGPEKVLLEEHLQKRPFSL